MGGKGTQQQLLGFGQCGGLVALEEEEIIASLLLGDQSTVGFHRVGGIPDEEHPGQVHLRQMRRDGGLLIGVLRHRNLIDHLLAGSLEVHQHERFLSFGLLQLARRIHRGHCLDRRRILLESGGRRAGVADHLAIQVEDFQRCWIQGGHPLRADGSQLIAGDLFEEPLKGPFTRHFKLMFCPRNTSETQLAPLPMVEALGELADRVGTLASGGDGQCRHGHDRGQ